MTYKALNVSLHVDEQKEALLERMKEVAEKEGSARESAKRFAYEVLPSLLNSLPDDFVGFCWV